MKFTKVLLVTILGLIFLTGCAQMQQKTSDTSASPVLDRIQQRGELVVGTMGNMPPLNMTSKDGEIFGLEPDLARLLANAMNVKVKFVIIRCFHGHNQLPLDFFFDNRFQSKSQQLMHSYYL